MVFALKKSVEGMLVKEVVTTAQAAQRVDAIQLPTMVPGTTLLAQRISGYDGPFLEDGSNWEVVNIAALHVYNAGEQEVRSACITLQLDGVDYVFYGEHFPPGETVVLLERYAAKYQKSTVRNCTGWQEIAEQAQQDGLLIGDKDNGTLIVTNTTDKTLYNLQLYYKAWLSPPDVYMGGISHCVTIPQLMPGQTELLYPDRYATGFSKVVSVISSPS